MVPAPQAVGTTRHHVRMQDVHEDADGVTPDQGHAKVVARVTLLHHDKPRLTRVIRIFRQLPTVNTPVTVQWTHKSRYSYTGMDN